MAFWEGTSELLSELLNLFTDWFQAFRGATSPFQHVPTFSIICFQMFPNDLHGLLPMPMFVSLRSKAMESGSMVIRQDSLNQRFAQSGESFFAWDISG